MYIHEHRWRSASCRGGGVAGAHMGLAAGMSGGPLLGQAAAGQLGAAAVRGAQVELPHLATGVEHVDPLERQHRVPRPRLLHARRSCHACREHLKETPRRTRHAPLSAHRPHTSPTAARRTGAQVRGLSAPEAPVDGVHPYGHMDCTGSLWARGGTPPHEPHETAVRGGSGRGAASHQHWHSCAHACMHVVPPRHVPTW